MGKYLIKSRMKWAEHMVKMKNEILPTRPETKKQEGSRKRGRPQLIWEVLCEEISEKGRE